MLRTNVKSSASPPTPEEAMQDNEEFMGDDDEGPNCFSFQYYEGDAASEDVEHDYGGKLPPPRVVNVSPKHCSGGN